MRSSEESKILVERVADRDPLALEGLYAAHNRGVYRLALRLGRGPTDAEEVVQDVFLELWKRPPMLEDVTLQAWLTVKTKSFCWKRFRQERRRPQLEPLREDRGYIDRSFELVARSSLFHVIDRRLAQMSFAHRQVLVMTLSAGMGPTEIAMSLRVPVITVRKRLSAAIWKLRSHLRGRVQGEGCFERQ